MSPYRPLPALIVFTVILVLSACVGAGPGSSTDVGPTSASAAASEAAATESEAAATDGGAAESAAASVASSEPVPSDALGEFSCELPIVEDPSVAIANITDVRVGAHDGYDRVVFEFEQGTPELSLDRVLPPLMQDPSGRPLNVEGTSFLRLIMRGGSKQTDAGTSSYDGPTDFDPGMTALVDLIEGGDFERQSTWYLGLTGEKCVRVMLLADPARLAIDIEH
jgi:hypothetical protein